MSHRECSRKRKKKQKQIRMHIYTPRFSELLNLVSCCQDNLEVMMLKIRLIVAAVILVGLSNAVNVQGKVAGVSIPNPNSFPLGVAQILKDGERICSGVHFKPWIVLTTASCLKGADPKSLQVLVYYRMPDEYRRIYKTFVSVKEYEADPAYIAGRPKHDMALLYIYSRFIWRVGSLKIPVNYTTPEEAATITDLRMSRWHRAPMTEKYYLSESKRKVSTNYGNCKEIDDVKYWYCVDAMDNKTETMNKMDIGVPLYYKLLGSLPTRRFLGLFTGWNMDQKSKGHLFQSLWPSIEWIDKFIADRPVPPVYNSE